MLKCSIFKLTHLNVTDAAAEELDKILLLMLGCAVQVGIKSRICYFINTTTAIQELLPHTSIKSVTSGKLWHFPFTLFWVLFFTCWGTKEPENVFLTHLVVWELVCWGSSHMVVMYQFSCCCLPLPVPPPAHPPFKLARVSWYLSHCCDPILAWRFHYSGLLIFRGKKKQNFAGFSEANSRKNRPISWDFRGKKSKFAQKLANFEGFSRDKVKIRRKIGRFRGILEEKSQISKDFRGKC